VTSLRAINSTAVSLSASAGVLNSEQKNDFDSFAQGHSGRMARHLYTHMKEGDRAKGIQEITDQMNQHFKRTDNENEDEEGKNYDSEEGSNYDMLNCDNLNMSPKKKMKFDVEKIDDWGLDHVDCNVNSRRIRWSLFEKRYILNFINKHSDLYDKYDQCLQSIWQADSAVRRQFHRKHINTSSCLRDAIRILL
jgi:hypothetical protein